MTDKYIELLEQLPFDLVHIAESYAKDNKSPKIMPAHLLRALLHKSAGLISFIEDNLNEDYYYIVDWADLRMQQCERTPYGMKTFTLSQETKQVIKEAKDINEKCGFDKLKAESLLASILTPGIGFTYEELKTMPLNGNKIISYISSDTTGENAYNFVQHSEDEIKGFEIQEYCIPLIKSNYKEDIVGFKKEINTIEEVLARKDRANLLIIGDTGVGKTSLIRGFIKLIATKSIPQSLSSLVPYELDLVSLSQGVSYKGEIEDRFKKILDALQNTVQPLLVIENFHRVEDKQSVLNGILPYIKKIIQSDNIQFVLTTTIDGFTFGHGLRSSEDISVFPQITFNSNDETEFIPLEDVKTIFVDKGARFVLVIGDCGNSVSENITAKKLIPNKNKTRLLKTKNNIKRTFFTVKGSVIVSASSKGEFALSDNRKGSIFAQSFFSNCTNYVRNGIWRDSNPSWSWRDILQDTKNDVAQKAKIIKSEKPCRQTTIYSIDIH